MLNYIRSELYRTARSRGFWMTLTVLTGLTVLLHVVLMLFSAKAPGFRYGNSSYAYSVLVSSPALFEAAGFLAACILYEADRRNGNDKNSVAFGISRTEIFAGKCITGLAAGTALMAVVLAVWAGCATLLLPQEGPVRLVHLLREAAAVFPSTAAALILGIVLLTLFEKSTAAGLLGGILLFILPRILLLMGTQVDWLWEPALWIPYNLLSVGLSVNTQECVAIWNSAQGLGMCLLAGAAEAAVFGLAGVLLLRRKEL